VRKRRNKIVVEPKSREELERLYGSVLTQQDVAKLYVLTAIVGNTVVVRRKDNGVVGSLDFQSGEQTLYFNWREAPPT
jgi:hypothetical protein